MTKVSEFVVKSIDNNEIRAGGIVDLDSLILVRLNNFNKVINIPLQFKRIATVLNDKCLHFEEQKWYVAKEYVETEDGSFEIRVYELYDLSSEKLMDRMDEINLTKLNQVFEKVKRGLNNVMAQYFDYGPYSKLFEEYSYLRDYFKNKYTDLLNDLEVKEIPPSSNTTDFEGRGYLTRANLQSLEDDIQKIFSMSKFFTLENGQSKDSTKNIIFISHGKAKDWLELQLFIERDIKIKTIELSQEPNMGRTILQKLFDEAKKCNYAIIVMTGDDVDSNGEVKARENVIHEIGFFQGLYGLDRICLLHDTGTSIPSNISGVVYYPFSKGQIKNTFIDLQRELKASGLI